ncbi:ATP-binding cassette domain-containing protein [Riemerella anatipestifer]|nr:ATP-binding cassette domain-containing protein [Riemerella anatipestifer]MBT0550932.1 ABC-F family ATP-binding cassette domain-containing protein [Riemerella anatipestifer]MBT0553085.1 ABC-F family ATP-binding cassette domain-containing protein [Riemerella anatipestifer]MCE3023776.1 ATP-binding cassette domain-containing protein [Riemerella anatipestifer]MCU7541785.1 ATP-binding cassette domain-containing protein [Riemerella anatipestifer]MCU7559573.1 ATP-binding cassette domain-containing 
MLIHVKSFSYNKEIVLQDIILNVKEKEKLSISGRNGCGKSTLLNIICGKLKGDIEIKNSLSMGYYGGHISLNKDLSLANHKDLFKEELLLDVFQNLVFGLEFKSFYNTKIKNLSQGNVVKAHMVFILSLNREIFILDEPTENLDNVSVDYLSNFIRQSNKRYIIVSHDRHFVSKTCENHYMINEKTLQKYEIN